jgi:hypothetical protein
MCGASSYPGKELRLLLAQRNYGAVYQALQTVLLALRQYSHFALEVLENRTQADDDDN